MAKAGDKGIWLSDYIKNYEPEHVVRMKFERGELGYTWFDINGSHRSSDDGGPQLPKGSWQGSRLRIDLEANAVKPGYGGSVDWMDWDDRPDDLGILRLFHVRVLSAAAPVGKKRHAPKSAPAIALLKDIYPLDGGRPSKEKAPNSKLWDDYHKECDARGIPRNDRVSLSQLLRCVGRKK